MGRLIDADNLQFNGRNYNKSQMKAILDFIDSQPTAYEPNKVVEQLKKDSYTETPNDMDPFDPSEVVNLESAIEIVEGGGVDAN